MSFPIINCDFRIPKIKKVETTDTSTAASTGASTTASTGASTTASTGASTTASTGASTTASTGASTTAKRNTTKPNHPKITISQLDMFRLCASLTILFIGDNSIRTLYRDFVQILSDGKLLIKNEATKQHGNYKEVEGEVRLQEGGTLGALDYKDVHHYFCETSSTQLIYIYIPTVFGDIAKTNINFLKTITSCRSIHVLIFSLYHGDLNFRKLREIKKKNFKPHLEQYDENLNKICQYLTNICNNKICGPQQKIWMSPYPPNFKLTKTQKEQFKEIIFHTDTIAEINDFKPFKRNFIWKKTHKELIGKNKHHFSPKGIRLMTQFLAKIIGRKRKRTIIK
ncbi:unnamed protein product [Rotaria sordida]|uniref:Uncharacterized protein n=1 Tax=Rotaria sordida TaxID=392033 RepID=A0A819BTQ5_9BILA|nr:unnamed protein product [Rotaria sordida]CAF3809174.1 unnamed protein product [Rotaria sordida]